MRLSDSFTADFYQAAYSETHADIANQSGALAPTLTLGELEQRYLSGEWETEFDATVCAAATPADLPPAFQRAYAHLAAL